MLDTFGHNILDLLKSTFSSVELTTLTFHPLHKLMTSHIEEEAIERLLKWPLQYSNGNNKLHLFASQPTLSPWVKPFATPSPPMMQVEPRPTGGRPLLPARLRFTPLPPLRQSTCALHCKV